MRRRPLPDVPVGYVLTPAAWALLEREDRKPVRRMGGTRSRAHRLQRRAEREEARQASR